MKSVSYQRLQEVNVTGTVAFFDILGYRSFLRNNSATETANKVLKFIASVGQETQRAMQETEVEPEQRNLFKQVDAEINAHTNWLVFSDTIVHTVAIKSEQKFSDHLFLTSLFSSEILACKMFMYGLPMRGVLHYGEFLSHENCLAGAAIVEAYEFLEELDFAGVIVTEAWYERAQAFIRAHDWIKHFLDKTLIQYLVPFSDGSEKKLWIVDFSQGGWGNEAIANSKDIEQLVSEKFWAFEKTIPMSVDRKVANTVKMLRYFRTRIDKEN